MCNETRSEVGGNKGHEIVHGMTAPVLGFLVATCTVDDEP